mmetsp:Transcript_50482/g.110408  ORF Transcript_50482/g.110408 Transcript_50482/m.110408 type:complete len:580 (-) Transcript_50482:39-1778(-)|eukprot:CAMPEP_0204276906 /NCGR_PEP_ID=MMETSP0468-20130131/28995_1 /ASSEMBLY_ACC=CAM_ASM_000383 /TAXON_ID=2969 /ORGANISM="Oxyrrhis marina" /LENGTH=579 /DNA_ID=CAMNT_0051253609 /DNA_START=24 /DNA_END=1763 /DNA_ORIENTATION=+
MLRVLLVAAAAALADAGFEAELQTLSSKVSELQELDKTAQDKVSCWCDSSVGTLKDAVDAEDSRATRLGHEIDQMKAQQQQYNSEISAHAAEAEQSQTSLDEAASMRETEAKKFKEDEEFHVSSLGSLDDGLVALKRQAITALQIWPRVQSLLQRAPQRQSRKLSALQLQEPSYDMVMGVMSSMKQNFASSLDDLRDKESTAAESYEGMRKARQSELNSAQRALQEKKRRAADTAQALVNAVQEKKDMEAMLEVDREMFLEVKQGCSDFTNALVDRTNGRNELAVTLSSAVKTLSEGALASRTLALQLSGSARQKLRKSGGGPVDVAAMLDEVSRQLDPAHPHALRVASSLLAGDTEQHKKQDEKMIADLREKKAALEEKLKACQTEAKKSQDKADEIKSDEEAASADLNAAAEDTAQIEGGQTAVQSMLQQASANVQLLEQTFQQMTGEMHMIEEHLGQMAGKVAEGARGQVEQAKSQASAQFAVYQQAKSDAVAMFEKVQKHGEAALSARHVADVNQKMVKAEMEEQVANTKDEIESTQPSADSCQAEEEMLKTVSDKLAHFEKEAEKLDDDMFWGK